MIKKQNTGAIVSRGEKVLGAPALQHRASNKILVSSFDHHLDKLLALDVTPPPAYYS